MLRNMEKQILETSQSDRKILNSIKDTKDIRKLKQKEKGKKLLLLFLKQVGIWLLI